jgi:hypothetical protein
MNELPIIFSHYGNVDYLSKSMLCATLTNPTKRKILIGDSSNRDSALGNGWEHIEFDSITSNLRTEFINNFRYIHGALHPNVKNQGDWLRYVFERWYFTEQFCKENQISQFWHFDSDVMLLEDLRLFEPSLIDHYDFTTQCNNMCLNGMVKTNVLTEYCRHMIDLFKDEEFLDTQQREFDTINPNYAFTEMRAYHSFSKTPGLQARCCHLESIFDGWWFDDCICQDDEFLMEFHPLANRLIKKVYFRNGSFIGAHKEHDVRFAAINLSWVPTSLFDWFIKCLQSRKEGASPFNSHLIEWKHIK